MATINFATREISAKIVYVGATGAGSNTNVRRLYEMLEAKETSRLHKFGPTDTEERSWYFQYVPQGDPRVATFDMVYHVYSLPGGLALPAHRDEVLRDVDGVVFVADSRPDAAQSNVDALMQLEGQLAARGLELSAVPFLLQLNHRDHPEALPIERLASELNPFGFPMAEGVAKHGSGVSASHDEITGAVEARLRDVLAGNEGAIRLTALHDPVRPTDDEVVGGHVRAIQDLSEANARADIDELTERQIEHLPEGPVVEVPFQPREFLGYSPSRTLDVQVERDEVTLELVMERMGGGEAKRLTVRLVNRPTDTPALTRQVPVSTAPPAPEVDRVFDYLPESVDITTPRAVVPARNDPPGVLYGMVGVIGGVVIGLLLAYLAGIVG